MNDPILLTPGPLTTRTETRRAMLRDWGSRDPAFIALTAEMRARLLAVAHGQRTHACVPLQGSGTFIVEAAIATLVRPEDKLLVLANGAYGERIATMARRMGRPLEVLRWSEDRPVEAASVAQALRADPGLTHVALVHCETTTGLLNPLAEVAEAVAGAGRHLLLDAMSSFGAIGIDLRAVPVTAVVASSNKCLEGVPGIGFALVEQAALARCAGVSSSLSLDLHDQWRGLERDGQWRFTPPVQVVAALVEALLQLEAAVQAPVIVTFRMPDRRPPLRLGPFYDALAARGFLIYPGKLTQAETFRIGCIGALDRHDFDRLLVAVADTMRAA